MGTFLARSILAGLTAFVVATAGASAAPDPAAQTLSTTVRISLTIMSSATVGRVDRRGAPSFFARDARGDDVGSAVQVVFTDRRGHRTVKGPQDIAAAVHQAERAGEDHVDVTFVF